MQATDTLKKVNIIKESDLLNLIIRFKKKTHTPLKEFINKIFDKLGDEINIVIISDSCSYYIATKQELIDYLNKVLEPYEDDLNDSDEKLAKEFFYDLRKIILFQQE